MPADVKTVQISIQEQLELDNYCDITRYEVIKKDIFNFIKYAAFRDIN